MISKKSLIIILAVIIIVGFIAFDQTKEEVKLEVHGERIANTSDFYLICQLYDSNGKAVDTPFGKLDITLWDETESFGEGLSEVPIEHGKCIMRFEGNPKIAEVSYDGGYFLKPCKYHNELQIFNSTNLTDEGISSGFYAS